jgi:hypothetical protein
MKDLGDSNKQIQRAMLMPRAVILVSLPDRSHTFWHTDILLVNIRSKPAALFSPSHS